MYDMLQPLVNQPGERWEYGINVDWAGFLLERITGMSLNDYMHEHIFAPLALSSTSLFPTEAMKNKFAFMHQKQSDGTYIGQEPLLRAPLIAKTQHDKKHVVNSGGAGAFTTPEEYCREFSLTSLYPVEFLGVSYSQSYELIIFLEQKSWRFFLTRESLLSQVLRY